MEWYDYEEEEEEVEVELRVEVQRWEEEGRKEGGENGHEGKGDDGMVILTTSSIPRWREGREGADRGEEGFVETEAGAARGRRGPFQAGRDARYEGEEGI